MTAQQLQQRDAAETISRVDEELPTRHSRFRLIRITNHYFTQLEYVFRFVRWPEMGACSLRGQYSDSRSESATLSESIV